VSEDFLHRSTEHFFHLNNSDPHQYNSHHPHSRHVVLGPMMSTRHIFVQPVGGSRRCRPGGVGGVGDDRRSRHGHSNVTTTRRNATFHRMGSRDTVMLVEEDPPPSWDEVVDDDRSLEESSSLEMSFLSSASSIVPSSSSVEMTTTFHHTHNNGSSDQHQQLQQQPQRRIIYSERERRLQLIRMEIEDLTLQLSSLSEGKIMDLRYNKIEALLSLCVRVKVADDVSCGGGS
jgi:hypothetical protein